MARGLFVDYRCSSMTPTITGEEVVLVTDRVEGVSEMYWGMLTQTASHVELTITGQMSSKRNLSRANLSILFFKSFSL